MTTTSHEMAVAERASELLPIDLDGIEPEMARDFLVRITLIRRFETAAELLVAKGAFSGGMHSAIGQEATAVGVTAALADSDIVTGTHRSHHITLAKGLPAREVMAELYGKATGSVGGRGGHMHLADMSRGHFGSNGIVGAGLGIALGAALAASVQERSQVVAGFFGDGGANVGRVWEFINLAALWRLPLVIVCENNLYAVETPLAQATAGGDISRRALGFGLPVETVDGQDVVAVYRATRTAAERARRGEGPTFIESLTYRHGGHDVGDRETYRTREEVAVWVSRRDPLARLVGSMISAGLADQATVDAIVAAADAEVTEAIEFAEASPYPDVRTLVDNVTELDMKIRGNR